MMSIKIIITYGKRRVWKFRNEIGRLYWARVSGLV